IPLAIGNASIDSLDTKTVAAALGEAGFVEEKAAVDTSQFTGDTKKKDISQKLYMSEQLGVTALIMTIKGESGGTTVCFITNNAADMLIPGAGKILAGGSDGGTAKKSDKSGGVGMGGLTLGMSENKVRQAMAKIPHDSMAGQGLSGLSAEDMKAYNDALQSVMTISRGRYTYLLRFNDKVLAAVIVMDMGTLFESVSVKDEKKEELIRMMFDK
ncbi:MAG TPA: hypothetical protein VJ521_15555, partial [Acidobacteriota bacterium]|nr:hypothetical protein [Acidobacteriota bacterium]